ncbi:unnamed protein product [Vitrella brassicaformis CCMP3155]|uniref:Uncharacterized protein n=2 Tax=Vitrella brassicaformis TaxID=1169539 RepID=A0A0G4EEM6_VITBC|nr:unnamed protein product [Vitrella brassicaformis CCMP3155]|eukprot:CEL94136.1 unnamed protein product [Vitrella brassicaformis CCMP3155]
MTVYSAVWAEAEASTKLAETRSWVCFSSRIAHVWPPSPSPASSAPRRPIARPSGSPPPSLCCAHPSTPNLRKSRGLECPTRLRQLPPLPPQTAAGALLRPTGTGGTGESVGEGSDVGDEVAGEGSVEEVVESLRTQIEEISWAGRVLRDEHSRVLTSECEMPIQAHNNEHAGQEDVGGSAVERLRQAAEKVKAAEASLLSAANTLCKVKLSSRQPLPEPPAADRVYGNVDARDHLLTMHSFWQLAKAAAPHCDHIVFDFRCRDEWESVPPAAAFEIGKRAVNLKTVVVRHPWHSPHWWIGGCSSFIEGHSRGVEERRRKTGQGGGIEELVFESIPSEGADMPRTVPHMPLPPIPLLPSFSFPALKSIKGAKRDHRHLFDSRRWRMPALERFEGRVGSFGAFCGTSDRLQSLDVGGTCVGDVAGVIEGFSGEGSSKLEQLRHIRGLGLGGRHGLGYEVWRLSTFGGRDADAESLTWDAESIDRLRDALTSRGCSKQHLDFVDQGEDLKLPTLQAIDRFLPAAVLPFDLPPAELSVSFSDGFPVFDVSLLHRIPAPSPLMKAMVRQLASLARGVHWIPDVAFIEHPTALSCESIRFNKARWLYIRPAGQTSAAGPSIPDPGVWSVIDQIAPSAFPSLHSLNVSGPFGCAAATRLVTAGKVRMVAGSGVLAGDVEGSEALDLMRAMGSGTVLGTVEIAGVRDVSYSYLYPWGNVGGLDEWARASARDELPKTKSLNLTLGGQAIELEQMDTMLRQFLTSTSSVLIEVYMRDGGEFLAAVTRLRAMTLADGEWTTIPHLSLVKVSGRRT